MNTPQAVYANGERFEGDWVHGKRHGKGTYTYADGSVYTGQWDNDRIHGNGARSSSRARRLVLITCVPAVVTGIQSKTHQNQNPNPQTGESKFANGNRYEGEWANGVISGKGALHIANGDKYTGEWKDGKMHGASSDMSWVKTVGN